ncbi:hypothetical protein BCR42DRAFT_406757 [Absidia repens]|uniref:NAD(P)-binding domain-containing protein n=1 Tax=Absidia repens TaxID=90262 RepID=A0A1X2IR99_9FUNG|nr:hypothetical protein BCR42DRAFT_406757 [Absidia repens]
MAFFPLPSLSAIFFFIMSTSIYISGATGYIGGAVVAKLLSNKQFSVTALVRNQEKANKLEQYGINTVIGSLADSALIEEQVFKHDITITAANCDSLEEAQAVVKGLERKYRETGQRGILVQTTGSGIVCDVNINDGNQANEHIYSDLDTSTLNNLPITNPHRQVDTYLIDHSANFDLVLIGPTTVFGEASRTLAFNPHSSQIPWAISVSLQNNAVYQVGAGKNSWSIVHVDDLADLYSLVVEKLVRNELSADTYLGRNGYFLPESGYYEWRQAFESIGQHLHTLGVIPSPEPHLIMDDDKFSQVYKFLPFKFGYGGNSRVSADKCRLIGWTPKHTLDDFLDDIRREAGVFAKKKGLIQ